MSNLVKVRNPADKKKEVFEMTRLNANDLVTHRGWEYVPEKPAEEVKAPEPEVEEVKALEPEVEEVKVPEPKVAKKPTRTRVSVKNDA